MMPSSSSAAAALPLLSELLHLLHSCIIDLRAVLAGAHTTAALLWKVAPLSNAADVANFAAAAVLVTAAAPTNLSYYQYYTCHLPPFFTSPF
jgi:hypothetical protein